jgi:amino acid adenylation domain-containing protein
MTKGFLPLHLAQRDIYFDQLVNPQSPHYNTGGYIKLYGALNTALLNEVARKIPTVFDSFKMRFDLTAQEAGFYVDHNFEEFELKELDFSTYDNPAQEAERWVQHQFNTPFLLTATRQPVEQVLLKLNDQEHWYVNRYHHLITDGYGFTVWAQYIANKYKALLQKDDAEFVYPSYQDEAVKTSAYSSSPDYETERNYWNKKITSIPQRLFVQKYPSRNSEEKKSGKHSIFLSDQQTASLRSLQEQSTFSLQQLTIAAAIIYFGKISGQSEFVIGVPIHKRRTKKLRSMVGTFSGILPFKGCYSANLTLTELLQNIKSTQKEDYRYQNYLISDLNRELKNSSDNPLFEFVINYELLNFELDFGTGLAASITHVTSDFEPLPLQLCWRDFGKQQALELRLDFQYAYFTIPEMALFSKRILFILEQFSTHLDAPVGSFNIVPESERQLVISTFNDTVVDYPKDKTVVDLFEQQVERTPDNTAIIVDGIALTYKQLNERANQVGHYLRSKGVKEGDLVPICIERGISMVVGVLGIIKAGGVYVPIDPEYPVERIKYMVDDAASQLAISSRTASYKLPKNTAYIEIENESDLINSQSIQNLGLVIRPGGMIYVIYTSGSTGTPKGAGVFHRSVVNLMQWYVREFSITSSDCNMIISSLGFDLTQKNIFGTLLAGAVITMPVMTYYDVHQILKCVRERSVTIINCAPSAFYPLAEHAEYFHHLTSLRLVILGGEPIRVKRLWGWIADTAYSGEIVNSYGPTECTDIASFYRLQNFESYNYTTIPIGRPNDNVQLFTVNESNDVQPVGVPGEICITGDSLGAGYLNDTELTMAKFIANPFGEGKLYRTGDLGRWLPNGNMEYLGRIDDQVKIRGYRIELGEIESVLQQHEFVHQAIVLRKPDSHGNDQLVAYVVVSETWNSDILISYLKSKLPEYMVPAIFMEMESLPLTPNGKIDKQALPDPEFKISSVFVAPRNEIEAKLTEIWGAVLNIDAAKISVTDNFFSLGGHSLLGVNLMAQISKVFSVEFQITILFECPEIGLLASRLVANMSIVDDPILININGEGDQSPIFCVPGAGGNAMSFHALGKRLGKDQPVFAFQAPGLNGKSLPLKTVEEMALVYIAEMQKIDPYGPYILAGYSFGASVIYEMTCQLKLRGFQVSKLIVFDAYEPHRIIGYTPLPGTEEENLCKMADIFAGLYGTTLNLSPDSLRNKSRVEQIQIIHLALNELVIDVTAEQVKGFIEVCFANTSCTYVPEYNELLNVPVTLFKPASRVVEENSWGLGKEMEKDSMGWQAITNEQVVVHNVSGDHWTLLNEPYVENIANLMKQELGIESNNGNSILIKA